MLDFPIALEYCQFSLNSALKLICMGLKNEYSRNPISLCAFHVFCAFNLKLMKGFHHQISVTIVPTIRGFPRCKFIDCIAADRLYIIEIYTVNIAIGCIASYFITEKNAVTLRQITIWQRLKKCNFALGRSFNFISEKVREPWYHSR